MSDKDTDMEHESGLDKFNAGTADDIRPIETNTDAAQISNSPHLKSAQATPEAPTPQPQQAPPSQPFDETAPLSSQNSPSEDIMHPMHPLEGDMNFIETGEEIDITKKDPTLRQLIVGAGWDQKAIEENKIDLDISCFLLNREDETRENEDFIYYNNEAGCKGAVKHLEDSRTGAGDGDDESISLDLPGIPFDVLKIIFTLSIYDPELQGQHIGMTRHIYIRLVNQEDGREIIRYRLEDGSMDNQTGILMLTMTREGAKWLLKANGEPVQGGLGAMAEQYGLIVAEQTG